MGGPTESTRDSTREIAGAAVAAFHLKWQDAADRIQQRAVPDERTGRSLPLLCSDEPFPLNGSPGTESGGTGAPRIGSQRRLAALLFRFLYRHRRGGGGRQDRT